MPAIAVTQLLRAVEERPDKRPLLSDLRERGLSEADSDVMAMLYRDDHYDEDLELPGARRYGVHPSIAVTRSVPISSGALSRTAASDVIRARQRRREWDDLSPRPGGIAS